MAGDACRPAPHQRRALISCIRPRRHALAEQQLDDATIITALLHDTIEDTVDL